MAAKSGGKNARPSSREIRDLKRLAAGIIRTQGNRFIKELLRARDIRIGANKDEFERNLLQAIETGALRLEDVRAWLTEVEGWGNQHVYLYRLSPALRAELTASTLRRRARDAGLYNVWDSETVLSFPDEPTLVSISFDDVVLRLIWQEASPQWTRLPDRDYTEEEGLDTIEFRAWRLIEHRAITRFEARLDRKLAALFIPNPIQGGEHKAALEEAKRVIQKLMDLDNLERGQLDVSVVSRNLDQRNVPTNVRPNPAVRTHKSRLSAGAAYVEFAANASDRAYWEEPAIQNVRASVRQDQLPAFEGSEGVFIFQPGAGHGALQRALRVQLYGRDDRIRLWAQMAADEAWTILEMLSQHER